MSDRWKVTVEAWPFSPATQHGETMEIAQKRAGERSASYVVRAVDMGDAFKAAEHIAMGIRANPAVWRAPITSIVKDN